MKVQIVWSEEDEIDDVRQRGRTVNSLFVVDGIEYVMSFVTFDYLVSVFSTYTKKGFPLPLSAWAEYLAIKEISTDEIHHAIEHLAAFNQLKTYVKNK
jgi:hypothetical protein